MLKNYEQDDIVALKYYLTYRRKDKNIPKEAKFDPKMITCDHFEDYITDILNREGDLHDTKHPSSAPSPSTNTTGTAPHSSPPRQKSPPRLSDKKKAELEKEIADRDALKMFERKRMSATLQNTKMINTAVEGISSTILSVLSTYTYN